MEDTSEDTQAEQAALVAALRDGSLDTFLRPGKFIGGAGRERIVNAALAAHRAGMIDIPGALLALPQNVASVHVQRFVEHSMPGLAMDCESMLAFIVAMAQAGEGDGFAFYLLNGLSKWCDGETGRPFAMLQLMRDDAALRDLMRPVIFAGLRINRVRFLPILGSMIEGDACEDRILAADIAHHFDGFTPADLGLIVPLLQTMQSRGQDDAASSALQALFAIAMRDPAHADIGIEALEAASPRNSPYLREGVARTAMFDIAKATDALAAAALRFLSDTESDEAAAIDALDHVLSHDLKGRLGAERRVLLDMLIDEGGVLLAQLDGVARGLLTGDAAELSATVRRWLTSDTPHHVMAVVQLCSGFTEESPHFDIDFTGASSPDAAVAVRRACAQLLGHPLSVASILVSALRTGPARVHPLVEALLFEPLLVNYWNSPREYLEGIVAAEPARIANPVRRALARLDDYIAAVEAVGDLPELHPSPHRRFLAETKRHEEQIDINRDAMRGSVFADIIPTALMLYGDAAVFDMHLSADDVRRQETEMQVHEYSHELPRLAVLDPFGSWYYRTLMLRGSDAP